jgi:diguanylate cyclase (GGDEF)-like protein
MVTSLARGRGSSMWIGTYKGPVHLDLETGIATRLPIDPKDPGQVPGGHTSALLLDRSGRLWIGSFGRGIQIQDGPDAGSRTRFRRLTTHDGLQQNSVDMLLMDGSGNIWATTDEGLAHIDAQTLKVRAYRTAQGVGVLDNWTGSGTVTPAGELIFGGLGGVTIVHPDRAAAVTPPPPLVVTEAHIGERALATSEVLGARRIALGAEERNLMLEFAALHYADPEHLSYRYRLLGFDQSWITTPISRRLVSYTNLPPGDFTLQLRATTSDGEWTAPLDLAIHVQPAWYQHAAVRALGAALALAVLGALVHLRTLYLRRRQRELQRLVAERTAELERRTRELRRSQEQLEQMAYFDSLTSLPNRRMFNDELRRLVAQSTRGQGDFALLLVDLDGFKQINDMRGHDVGDHLLATMAQRLAGLMRESDRVARLGGDEFAVLLAQPCSPEAIESACARLLAKLSEPLDLDGTPLQVSASIGVAVCPGEGKSPGALYKAADQALYEAKRAGRNTWRRITSEACAA